MFSVNIRSTTVALATPDALRGRVLAVENVFIGASNELGAFESGAAAALLGAVAAVVAGGVVTIGAGRRLALALPRRSRGSGSLEELAAETGRRARPARCRVRRDGDRPHPPDPPPRRGRQPPARGRGRDGARGAREPRRPPTRRCASASSPATSCRSSSTSSSTAPTSGSPTGSRRAVGDGATLILLPAVAGGGARRRPAALSRAPATSADRSTGASAGAAPASRGRACEPRTAVAVGGAAGEVRMAELDAVAPTGRAGQWPSTASPTATSARKRLAAASAGAGTSGRGEPADGGSDAALSAGTNASMHHAATAWLLSCRSSIATPRGRTRTGQRVSSIRYSAAALIVTRPLTVPGLELTTTKSTLPGACSTTVAPNCAASASAVSRGAGIALLADRRDRPDGVVALVGEAGRRERERDRATVEQPARRGLRVDVARGRPVLGAEDDRVGPLAEREVAQPLGRRGAEHDVAGDVGEAERGRPGVEQRLRRRPRRAARVPSRPRGRGGRRRARVSRPLLSSKRPSASASRSLSVPS